MSEYKVKDPLTLLRVTQYWMYRPVLCLETSVFSVKLDSFFRFQFSGKLYDVMSCSYVRSCIGHYSLHMNERKTLYIDRFLH
jgi:hypothetical protein